MAKKQDPEKKPQKPAEQWKPDLSPKQVELMRLCNQKTGTMKFIGVFGTRWSGKTTGSTHAIANHLWNTKNASVLVLCYTQGTAATSGVWNELTEKVIPEWIRADIGMEWEVEPKVHGSTKKMICSVTNKHGGVSKLELDTLDDENEVEDKFKSRYYSMIYWSEASEFKQALTMMTLFNALRVSGLPDEEHVMLIDANPAEEGQDHFLYKFFYEVRVADYTTVDETLDEKEKLEFEANKAIQKSLFLTEWTMNDNPYLSEEKKNLIRGTYVSDPQLFKRYILGQWIRVASKKAIFGDIFRRAIHVIGDVKDKDPEILVPEENCEELICGYDTGSTNPCSYIIEKVQIPFKKRNEKGQEVTFYLNGFKFLDEIENIGKKIIVREITQRHMERMRFWESYIGKEIRWKHWADNSALTSTESIVNRTVADEIFVVSDGKIRLVGVEKTSGSVASRIRLWRKLLLECRILISGSRCPKLVEANEALKSGNDPMSIIKGSPHKHPFDAGSYPLVKECWEELQEMVSTVNNQNRVRESSIVSVRL